MARVDRAIPVTQIRSVDSYLSTQLQGQRFIATLFTIFAAVALGIGTLGIYGVTAHAVSDRFREFGIRRALGAGTGNVLGLVTRRSLVMLLVGVACGVGASFALTRFLENMLGRHASDPATFATIAAILTGTADSTLTCETRLDPMGNGFQLVVKENARERIEAFTELPKLLSREHELVQAWKAQGWRETSQPSRTPVDTWSGPTYSPPQIIPSAGCHEAAAGLLATVERTATLRSKPSVPWQAESPAVDFDRNQIPDHRAPVLRCTDHKLLFNVSRPPRRDVENVRHPAPPCFGHDVFMKNRSAHDLCRRPIQQTIQGQERRDSHEGRTAIAVEACHPADVCGVPIAHGKCNLDGQRQHE